MDINKLLQNLGYEPNKESSNKNYTAYNINSKGNETVMIGLIVDNKKNIWTDVSTNVRGNINNLVINLNKAKSYSEAIHYVKNFVAPFEPWISTNEDESYPENTDKVKDEKEELLNLIYELQTFVKMTQTYFINGFGLGYLRNFNTNVLINNNDFKDFFHKKSIEEMNWLRDYPEVFSEVKKEKAYLHNAKLANFPKLNKTSRKRRLVSIKSALEDLEQAAYTKAELGYGDEEYETVLTLKEMFYDNKRGV